MIFQKIHLQKIKNNNHSFRIKILFYCSTVHFVHFVHFLKLLIFYLKKKSKAKIHFKTKL